LAVADSNKPVSKRKDRDQNDQEMSTAQKKICTNEEPKDGDTSNDEESAAGGGGLSSLLAGYDSSSSQEDGEVSSKPKENLKNGSNGASQSSPEAANANEEATTNTTHSQQKSQPKRICKYYQRGRCRHGTNCNFLHTEPSTEQKQKARLSQSERDKARNAYERELHILGLSTPSHKNRYDKSGAKVINNTSLLHKLLQRDKEREWRMTLQLLRYIVDCDYFQKNGNDDGDKDDEKASADNTQPDSGKGDRDEDTKQPAI
jgi:hypothetical protein